MAKSVECPETSEAPGPVVKNTPLASLKNPSVHPHPNTKGGTTLVWMHEMRGNSVNTLPSTDMAEVVGP